MRQTLLKAILAVFSGAALVIFTPGPAARAADWYYWTGAGTGGNTATDPADPTTQWNNPANWQEGSPPAPSANAALSLTNAGYVNAGSAALAAVVVDGPSAEGAYHIADGVEVTTAPFYGAFAGYHAQGRVIQTGGSLTVSNYGMLSVGGPDANARGYYDLQGGFLNVTGASSEVNIGRQGTGVFTQTGGTFIVQNAMYVGREFGNGVLNLGGGTLRAGTLDVGQSGASGTLNITDSAARIEASYMIALRQNSTLTAVPGSEIHLPGTIFRSYSNDETALSGLENLAVVFDGTRPMLGGSMEVAGRDLGPIAAGFADNFALGSLVVGSDVPRSIWLEDVIDNGNRSSAEALYVHNLTVGAGSKLDLAGLHLYYDGTLVNNGTMVGGTPLFVPEPGTLGMLLLGSANLLLGRVHRRSCKIQARLGTRKINL